MYSITTIRKKHHRIKKNIQHKKHIPLSCLNRKKCQQQHFILYLFVAPTFAWEGNKMLYVFLNNNKHIFFRRLFFHYNQAVWKIINKISRNMENAFRLYTYLYWVIVTRLKISTLNITHTQNKSTNNRCQHMQTHCSSVIKSGKAIKNNNSFSFIYFLPFWTWNHEFSNKKLSQRKWKKKT